MSDLIKEIGESFAILKLKSDIKKLEKSLDVAMEAIEFYYADSHYDSKYEWNMKEYSPEYGQGHQPSGTKAKQAKQQIEDILK